MADVLCPARLEDPVQLLPASQKPFGSAEGVARLSNEALSVLYHYGVQQPEVEAIVAEGFRELSDFRVCNPDGDLEAKHFFKMSVEDKIQGALPLARVIRAFRRMNRQDPLAALPTVSLGVDGVLWADPPVGGANAALAAAALPWAWSTREDALK